MRVRHLFWSGPSRHLGVLSADQAKAYILRSQPTLAETIEQGRAETSRRQKKSRHGDFYFFRPL